MAENKMWKSESEIIFHLNEDKDAYVVADSKYIVHVKEYDRIKALIRESLEAACHYLMDKQISCISSEYRNQCPERRREYDGVIAKKRCHDTIMLAGMRGSGKTTFMLSILSHIRSGKFGIVLNGDKNAEHEIETLPIFDPTLIEEKTHIFANVISMIKDRVDQKAKRANCFDDDGSEAFRKFRSWEKSFQALAEGLPTLDRLGGDGFNSESWLDPQFVMDKGIRMAHAANVLEVSFHEFVRESLEFLGKKAFILCFDDVDTNFGKGWPVLEVLHKYLTTPQMIIVLSGDPALYSTLIRQRQWENFGDKLLKQECRNEEHHRNLSSVVAHLEQQYFLKLLKPQRRIFLNNLYQLNSVLPVRIIHDGDERGEFLQPKYERLLTNQGTGRSDKGDSYRFLASLPLRSQKQLLLAAVEQERQTPATRGFIQDIFDIFWSDLNVKGVAVSSLRNNPETVSIHILNYLVANDLLSEGATLNQNFNDPLTNGAQFALGMVLHDQVVNDPAQVFEYWVRVCMAREVGVLMGDRHVSRGEGPSIQNFIDHCALDQSKSPRYLARFSTAYLRAFRAYKNINTTRRLASRLFEEKAWHGTLPLYGLAEKSNDALAKRETRIDYVLFHPDAKTPPLLRIIGSIPLSGATDHSKRALPIYSVYNILGILGQIVGTARQEEQKFDHIAGEVAALLYRDAQFREYPLPNWASSYGIENQEGVSDLPSNPEQFDSTIISFAERLVLWANLFDGRTVSAAHLAKMFTRLFYTLNNLDTQCRDRLLGEWLHRIVVILLHSAVVVEAMEHHNIAISQLQLTNPVTADNILIDNLTKLNQEPQGDEGLLPFSRWFLACPLWELYLNANADGKKLTEKISQFVKPFVKKQFKQPIFTRFDKTESDFYLDIYGDYNLIRLLIENEVVVRGHDLKKTELDGIDEQVEQAEPVEQKKTEPEGSNAEVEKTAFTFQYKKRLITAFVTAKLTQEKVKDMKKEDLEAFLTSSSLGGKFIFPKDIVARIKKRIGNKLTW